MRVQNIKRMYLENICNPVAFIFPFVLNFGKRRRRSKCTSMQWSRVLRGGYVIMMARKLKIAYSQNYP
jgi:hypothetical protein